MAWPPTSSAGQRLVIPGGGSASGTAGGQAGAARPAGSGQVYTVRRGDTLAAIAYRYGTTIMKWALRDSRE